ncbi:MAG: 6-carboxytetrahydropterin synthase QueD [Phycisphaerales bacterium]
MEIFKEFRFEAAHRLEGLPPGHKCAGLHGHSYRVVVFVRGKVDPATGWVMDFADVKRAVAPTIDRLDHSYLNEIDGLGQPTTEVLAQWLWRRIAPELPGLARLEVWETATSGCVYAGEDE